VDCEEFTCSMMVKAHTVPKALRHHRVLPLDEAREFFRKENSCPLHVGEQVEVYDRTCRKAVCSICALLPEHRGESLQFKHSPLISSPFLCSQAMSSVR
jgi:hypothetical protein